MLFCDLGGKNSFQISDSEGGERLHIPPQPPIPTIPPQWVWYFFHWKNPLAGPVETDGLYTERFTGKTEKKTDGQMCTTQNLR